MRWIYGTSAHPRWAGLFGLWLLLLSGIFANFVGSPGILQAVRLRNFLEVKKKQLVQVKADLIKLQFDSSQLENSRTVQIREIRRVLGYAANDEIIFDFTTSEF